MAKKKTASKKPDNKKIAFPLRLDPDVMDAVRKLAEGAEISLNQLLHGLARFAAQNGFVGEPVFMNDKKMFATIRKVPGVVAFGKPAVRYSKQEAEDYQDAVDEPAPEFKKDGEFFFMLDFTERRVVRED